MDWTEREEEVIDGIEAVGLEDPVFNAEVETPTFADLLPERIPSRPSPQPSHGSEYLKVDLRGLDYTKPIDENLICPVCRVAFIDPVTTSCDHVFCRDCFDQSYAIARICPIDRKPLLAPHDIGPTHRLILNQLDSLEVRCPNKAEGCSKILPRSMVQNHVQKYCDCTVVLCKDSSCGRELLRKDSDKGCLHKLVSCPDCGDHLWQLDMEKHREDICGERKMNCGLCGQQISRVHEDDHGLECEEAWTACKWSIYGCPHRSTRRELAHHKLDCNLEVMGPVVESMKEEIKGLRNELQFLNEKDRVKDRRLRFLECTRNALNTETNHMLDISLPDPSSMAEPGPYDSRDQYMLSLLEHQESQVDRLSAGMTELEAKQTMMLFNETLPIKEQLAEIRSTQSTLGMHVRWLMQFRMKDSRGATKASSSNDKPGSSGPGPSLGPIRRLSDSLRENITKL